MDDNLPYPVLAVMLLMVGWVVFGAIASLVHGAKRFSLRTLLIAMTLVAVVLGLAVWLLSP